MKFQKFHFMNGTMCATSSKKKMTAILLGLTLALAPYGMTGAEAAAKSGTEARQLSRPLFLLLMRQRQKMP